MLLCFLSPPLCKIAFAFPFLLPHLTPAIPFPHFFFFPSLLQVIPCGMVLKSIGYKSEALPGIPFDSRSGTIPSLSGRVLASSRSQSPSSPGGTETDANVIPHLYVTGWVRRGPSGIIGTNITDAGEVVKVLLADKAQRLHSGDLAGTKASAAEAGSEKPSEVVKRIVMEHQAGNDKRIVTDWKGWLRISDKEVADGQARGKYREKVVQVPEMIELANPV